MKAVNTGRFAEAEAMSRRRTSPVSGYRRALRSSRGRRCRRSGGSKRRLPVSEKAIRMDPNYAEARTNYARILWNLGRAPEGVHQCNIGLRLAPGLLSALLCRAECYKDLKRAEDAIMDLKRAIALKPDAEVPPHDLARLLYDERDFFEARDVLLAAKKRGIYPPGYGLLMGLCLSEIGQDDEAVAEYEKIIEKNPNNLLARARIAELAQSQGDFEKAADQLQEGDQA